MGEVDLRQWVLTFPFAWRRRLAHDGALLCKLSALFVRTVQAFYAERAAGRGIVRAKTGALTVVQRTSSDLRLNPHLHVVFLDGSYHEQGEHLRWQDLVRLTTSEVGRVLERTVRTIQQQLERAGMLQGADIVAEQGEVEDPLSASAVSGQSPPAGPQWQRGLAPLSAAALQFDKPLCASLDGFSLHAATRAGALHVAGREALLRYVLRPPLAEQRLSRGRGGLVRILLKRAYRDGTLAVELDPLSLLCRLATSVPPPRFHTVKYSGVLAPASRLRPRITPKPKARARDASPQARAHSRSIHKRSARSHLGRGAGLGRPTPWLATRLRRRETLARLISGFLSRCWRKKQLR